MEKSKPCARHVIVGYFREMQSHKTGAIEGTDIEFVHDMRVASRRLRTVLDDVAAAFPQRVDKKFKKRYKKIRKITRTMGAVRDLDVLIARFHAEKTVLPERETTRCASVDYAPQRETGSGAATDAGVVCETGCIRF